MRYELFLQVVKDDLEKRLGEGYQVTLRSIPKNNGVILDGISICRKPEGIAPTIYLNAFYQELSGGQPLSRICDKIHQLYLANPDLPYLDSRVLSSYPEIKDRIVYKLVNTRANTLFLRRLPHLPFQDMSMICYLLIEQSEKGYVTALIHKDHLKTWKIREKDLFLSAIANTPALLPPVIQPMNEMLKQLAGEMMEDNPKTNMIDILMEAPEEYQAQKQLLFPSLYVLTNPARVNGAACMAYPHAIKDFAEKLGQDVLILPSSIHEVLLVADDPNYDYEDMSRLVKEINEGEVAVEDRLSNQVYRYSLDTDQIMMVSHGSALSGTKNR